MNTFNNNPPFFFEASLLPDKTPLFLGLINSTN
nr:MAG TPA_asm: corticosteroid-binding globulin protein [Caudoviricetes sp.]